MDASRACMRASRGKVLENSTLSVATRACSAKLAVAASTCPSKLLSLPAPTNTQGVSGSLSRATRGNGEQVWEMPASMEVASARDEDVAITTKRGVKRLADKSNLNDEQRFTKRFNLLSLRGTVSPWCSKSQSHLLLSFPAQIRASMATATPTSQSTGKLPTLLLQTHHMPSRWEPRMRGPLTMSPCK